MYTHECITAIEYNGQSYKIKKPLTLATATSSPTEDRNKLNASFGSKKKICDRVGRSSSGGLHTFRSTNRYVLRHNASSLLLLLFIMVNGTHILRPTSRGCSRRRLPDCCRRTCRYRHGSAKPFATPSSDC